MAVKKSIDSYGNEKGGYESVLKLFYALLMNAHYIGVDIYSGFSK